MSKPQNWVYEIGLGKRVRDPNLGYIGHFYTQGTSAAFTLRVHRLLSPRIFILEIQTSAAFRLRTHRPLSPLGYISCVRPRIFILMNQTSADFILRVHRPLSTLLGKISMIFFLVFFSLCKIVIKIGRTLLATEKIKSQSFHPMKSPYLTLPSDSALSTQQKTRFGW